MISRFLLTLTFLSASIVGAASVHARPEGQPLPASVAKLAGVQCDHKSEGWSYECTYQGYVISADDRACDGADDAMYGDLGLSGNKSHIALLDKFPQGGSTVAEAADRQFICVSAKAKRASPYDVWYYVVAIPVASVKACKNNSNCGAPGDLPVKLTKQGTGQPCHLTAQKRYAGDCAAGWVNAAEVDLYSMGL
ncbi:MAG TPA: hypothetical protein VIM98_00170 [Dyella sp.]|uniref:hypothetical protein n=1 Tax=Dyella sp. TaxID=1869338 RepID=UPI002F93AB4F